VNYKRTEDENVHLLGQQKRYTNRFEFLLSTLLSDYHFKGIVIGNSGVGKTCKFN
jgi:hypothetical protein